MRTALVVDGAAYYSVPGYTNARDNHKNRSRVDIRQGHLLHPALYDCMTIS